MWGQVKRWNLPDARRHRSGNKATRGERTLPGADRKVENRTINRRCSSFTPNCRSIFDSFHLAISHFLAGRGCTATDGGAECEWDVQVKKSRKGRVN